MNTEDLKYLNTMAEESKKRALSDDEIKRVADEINRIAVALRTDPYAYDINTAFDIAADIFVQQAQYGADIDKLAEDILYYSDLKETDYASAQAVERKISIAAQWINDGKFDKVDLMSFNYFTIEAFYSIADRVTTLEGMKYMEDNFIDVDYYQQLEAIFGAATPQTLEHYIAMGADVYDTKWDTHANIYDHMIASEYFSPEDVKKFAEILPDDIGSPIGTITYGTPYISKNGAKKIEVLNKMGKLDEESKINIVKFLSPENSDLIAELSQPKSGEDYLTAKVETLKHRIGGQHSDLSEKNIGKTDTAAYTAANQEQMTIMKAMMERHKSSQNK